MVGCTSADQHRSDVPSDDVDSGQIRSLCPVFIIVARSNRLSTLFLSSNSQPSLGSKMILAKTTILLDLQLKFGGFYTFDANARSALKFAKTP